MARAVSLEITLGGVVWRCGGRARKITRRQADRVMDVIAERGVSMPTRYEIEQAAARVLAAAEARRSCTSTKLELKFDVEEMSGWDWSLDDDTEAALKTLQVNAAKAVFESFLNDLVLEIDDGYVSDHVVPSNDLAIVAHLDYERVFSVPSLRDLILQWVRGVLRRTDIEMRDDQSRDREDMAIARLLEISATCLRGVRIIERMQRRFGKPEPSGEWQAKTCYTVWGDRERVKSEVG